MRNRYFFFSSFTSRLIVSSAAVLLLRAGAAVAQGLPPNNPSQDQNRNWTVERTYDGNNNVVSESKQFTDGLGRPTQAQARNAATKQVFATQTVYNTGGKPVLETLAAPINNQGFRYHEGFFTYTDNGQTTPYSAQHFEGTNASSPRPADATLLGTLGYYFSQLNTQEPLTPITSYPFSLVEPYEGPLGGTKRAAGPGDELRMGKGREAKGREFPLRKEFDDYIRLRPQFVPGSPQVTLEYQGMKSVSINADGRESIVVANKEGQAIISCLSGPQYPALPVYGFISSDATNRYDNNAPVYQDIHIPAAGPQDVKFTMGSYATNGGKIRIINLLTDQSTDYLIAPPASPGAEPELHVTLDPGFYRFVSVEGTQWSYYEAHYGNFSYTYYDDAGHAVATIAPNGLLGNPAQVTTPSFVTRNTYDTSGRLLSTQSIDEGRSEYVYAQDGRIRFSQSALQRAAGRFSYSNYDETDRVVESGEYTSIAGTASQTTSCGLQYEGQDIVLTAPAGQVFTDIRSATFGGGGGADCTSFAFQTGCSADVTATVQRLVAAQLANRATVLRIPVNINDLGDPCSGTWKALRVVATSTTLPAAITECGLQQEGQDLVLTAPAGQTFTGIQSAMYGTGNGASCTTFSFQAGCSTDVTTAVQQLAVTQLRTQPTVLRIPVNNIDLGADPCPGAGKTLRVIATCLGTGGAANSIVVFENHTIVTPSATSTLQPALLEARVPANGLDPSRCAQRNQVWYDLPWDGTAKRQDGTVDPDHQDSQLINLNRKQEFVVGAVAKTKNDNVTTWYSYDELGRVTWVMQDIAFVGVKTLDYKYDFSGNVLEVAYQKDQPDRFYHYYTYDAAQRLTTVATSSDGNVRTPQAEYSYYLHGPLKRVQVAGNLQGIDYTYTLQGALKSINHVNQTLEPGHDSPRTNGVQKDLFALTLDYFSGDYRSRNLDVAAPTDLTGLGVPTRYDGTIQGAAWRTAASSDVHRVAYTYDEKSQLQDAQYGPQFVGTGTTSNFLPTNRLREGNLSYDANGNMKSLSRTDQQGATTDNFSYSYKPNTNKLTEVHTGSASGTTVLDYDYDELGQMTRQRDEQGQRYFTYDVTGKTTGIFLDAAHNQPLLTFGYDDRGFRVRKTTFANSTIQSTIYVRDVAGNILATYEKAGFFGAPQRTEVPIYGSGRLGTLTRLNNGSEDYRYELTDHLGNARVVFHRPTTDTGTETMELSGVPAQYAFQGANTYRAAPASGGYNGSTFVAELDGRQVNTPTLSRSVAVQQGDTITFTAWAKVPGSFNHPNRVATSPAVQPYLLLGAATATDEVPTRLPDGQLTRTQTGAGRWLGRLAAGLSITLPSKKQALPLGTGPVSKGTPYNAWIKYQVFDVNGQPIYGQEQTAYVLNNGTTSWQQLRLGVRVPQGGTIELTATSAETSSYVFFDELKVEQTGGLIVQEQHQYAYGAPLPGLSYTVGNRRYRYGYQGQYAEHDTLTGFDSFELRLYNSRIGRWMSYDPEGQFNSPYVGMGNNPVSGIDPDGGFSIGPLGAVGIGAGLGAIAGGLYSRNNGGDFLSGAAAGAAVGGIAGAFAWAGLHGSNGKININISIGGVGSSAAYQGPGPAVAPMAPPTIPWWKIWLAEELAGFMYRSPILFLLTLQGDTRQKEYPIPKPKPENEDDYVNLFRGVGPTTIINGVRTVNPAYPDALMRMAIPRGGTATARGHNGGNTDSPYTSWSTSIDVANYFANKGGAGVILNARIHKSRLSYFNHHAGEMEVQVLGPVYGARLIPSWPTPGTTWDPYVR